MNLSKKALYLAAFMLSGISAIKAQESKYDYLYQQLPFEMKKVALPTIREASESIVQYGAVGDGVTLNTKSINAAMQALSAKGGGHLVIPAGIWLTGPVVFASGIDLHLEKGALLLFTADHSQYPLVKAVFEGQETRRCQSPISGINLTNISITGDGTINGSGESWRALKKAKVTDKLWEQMTSGKGIIKGSTWYPSEGYLKGEEWSKETTNALTDQQWESARDFLRPVMVSFIQCKKVLLQGVLFENSPSWNLHPLLCEDVILDRVFVRNPDFAQNGDGIDLESCKNSLIVNSTFDVGDDAICVKSGKDAEGRKRGVPTEFLIVDNCKVFQAHGGFVVGSEMSGGARNISVKNCQFLGTDVGLRFKSCRGRGGIVENIYIEDIYMSDIVTDSFLFDLYYGGRSASEELEAGNKPVSGSTPIADSSTPCFRNIYVRNLVSHNARRAMFFNGLPEMNISNINIENATISAKFGAELVESDGIRFKNVQVIPTDGAAYVLKNVRNFEASGLGYPEKSTKTFSISGAKTMNIQLPLTADKKSVISASADVDLRQIKLIKK